MWREKNKKSSYIKSEIGKEQNYWAFFFRFHSRLV